MKRKYTQVEAEAEPVVHGEKNEQTRRGAGTRLHKHTSPRRGGRKPAHGAARPKASPRTGGNQRGTQTVAFGARVPPASSKYNFGLPRRPGTAAAFEDNSATGAASRARTRKLQPSASTGSMLGRPAARDARMSRKLPLPSPLRSAASSLLTRPPVSKLPETPGTEESKRREDGRQINPSSHAPSPPATAVALTPAQQARRPESDSVAEVTCIAYCVYELPRMRGQVRMLDVQPACPSSHTHRCATDLNSEQVHHQRWLGPKSLRVEGHGALREEPWLPDAYPRR